MLNIYSKDFHPATDIEINLFGGIWDKMNEAVKKGFAESKATDPDDDFRAAILRNNAVFSAFKVHRLQNDMARLLLDSNGNLKPFEQWRSEVLPIAFHNTANPVSSPRGGRVGASGMPGGGFPLAGRGLISSNTHTLCGI